MNKIYILILIFALHGCSSNAFKRDRFTDYGFYIDSGAMMKLMVVPTFWKPVVYEVFDRGPNFPGYMLVTKYAGRGGYNWGGIESQKSVPLSPYDIEDIKIYLKRALDFPKMDYSISTDGSVWALESMLYQYTAVAFENPQDNTKRRGLEDFVFMKEYLEKLAK